VKQHEANLASIVQSMEKKHEANLVAREVEYRKSALVQENMLRDAKT